jgi:hypothetical protein
MVEGGHRIPDGRIDPLVRMIAHLLLSFRAESSVVVALRGHKNKDILYHSQYPSEF